MKLFFLGQSYVFFTPALKLVPSSETYRFLGVSYPGKRAIRAEYQPSTETLIYRGCPYTH